MSEHELCVYTYASTMVTVTIIEYEIVISCVFQCLEGKSHVQNLHLQIAKVNSNWQRSVKGTGRAEIETLSQSMNQSDRFIIIQNKGPLLCKTRRTLELQRQV